VQRVVIGSISLCISGHVLASVLRRSGCKTPFQSQEPLEALEPSGAGGVGYSERGGRRSGRTRCWTRARRICLEAGCRVGHFVRSTGPEILRSLCAPRRGKGWLRLNFLTSGGQRVAFDYSLSYENRMFLLKLGYDPVFSAYSPSNLLLAMAVENAFEQERAKYDFLGESADWKSCWSKKTTSNYWLFVFSNSFKGRCLHFLKFRVGPGVKSFRERWSAKKEPV